VVPQGVSVPQFETRRCKCNVSSKLSLRPIFLDVFFLKPFKSRYFINVNMDYLLLIVVTDVQELSACSGTLCFITVFTGPISP
jgi:hypothetical protein